jgi:hypothetical protein
VRFGNEDVRCAWWRWIITDLPDNPEIECCRAPTISKLVNECGGLGRDRRNQTWCRVHRLSSCIDVARMLEADWGSTPRVRIFDLSASSFCRKTSTFLIGQPYGSEQKIVLNFDVAVGFFRASQTFRVPFIFYSK